MSNEMSGPAPAVPPARRGGTATGKELLKACWDLLKQDRELIALPFVGGLVAILAAAVLFVPGYAIGWFAGGQQNNQAAYWIGIAFGAFAATVVATYFQAALVIGANERAEGRDPSRSSVLALAWRRRGRILSWAVVTTTVGLVLRFISERLGPASAIVAALGDLAWGIATFLVVPVVVSEDIGPFAAVKRSGTLLKDTWGTSLRTTVRFGLIALLAWLPAIALLVVGIVVIAGGGDTRLIVGSVLVAVAVIAMIVLGTVFSAITAYARALIYRYATGRPTPGIDPQLFAGAFRPKKLAL
jgi:hypothetical protein